MVKLKKNIKEVCKNVIDAMQSGDKQKIYEACEEFHESISEQIISKLDTEEQDKLRQFDKNILQARGVRQLTVEETNWYNKLIEVSKSSDAKQAFISILGGSDEDAVMPMTIFESIYKELEEEYELFSVLNFNYVGYTTRWILNDNTRQKAVWGEITDAITKEITSGLKVIDLKQNKLTAFAQIENGMLDLGPAFLDGYIRTCLKIALLNGFEDGIINGNGLNQPIGMIKDIHHGVSVNQTTGYPDKTPISITSFSPKDYCAVISNLVKTESYEDAGGVTHGGKLRMFNDVVLLCNNEDYLLKILPATTVQNANGVYVNDLFPFPTRVIKSNAIETGKALLFLPDKYFLGVGGDRNQVIEYDDSYKFLEDLRTYRIRQYAAGRFEDDTCCVYLDISDLDPAYITVNMNVSA